MHIRWLTYSLVVVGMLAVVAVPAARAEETYSSLQDFLFGDSGLVYTQPEEPTYSTATESSWFGSGFYDFFANLFTGGGTDSSTATDTQTTSTETVEENTPTLACIPGILEKEEPFLLLWQCNDGSTEATLQIADTVFTGAGAGIMRMTSGVISETDTTATETDILTVRVTCAASQTEATCTLSRINPTISLSVSAETVPMWEAVTINWQTTDMQQCTLTSDDDNSKYAEWQRNGTQGYQIRSHPITKDTTFTLTCTTKTGLEKSASVTVGATSAE